MWKNSTHAILFRLTSIARYWNKKQKCSSHQHKHIIVQSTGFSFPFTVKILRGKKRALPYPPSHLQLFDEMTDDNGVTNAFLFTNLAILVNAKAMVDKFWSRFCTELLNDSELNINWRHRTSRTRPSRRCLGSLIFSPYFWIMACSYTELFAPTLEGAGRKRPFSLA